MASLGSFPPQRIAVAEGPRPDPSHGVFETLLAVAGAPVELGPHLSRLDASTRELYGAPAPARARELLLERAAELDLGRVRVTLTPNQEGTLEAEATSAAVDPALVFPDRSRALDLVAVAVEDWPGAHKWADRRLLAAAERRWAPAVPLLVGADGAALEASRGNVFAVFGGRLATPPVDGRILPGVTRARVCEFARAAGLAVDERPLPLAELAAADEVFVTGAVRGIEPVGSCTADVRWDGPAPVTERLGRSLRQAWGLLPGAGAAADLP